jgi:hypothetical protein
MPMASMDTEGSDSLAKRKPYVRIPAQNAVVYQREDGTLGPGNRLFIELAGDPNDKVIEGSLQKSLAKDLRNHKCLDVQIAVRAD